MPSRRSKDKINRGAGATPVARPAGAIWAARMLLLIAAAAAGYLATVSLAGGGVAGCGPASDCNKVLQSRWAYWFGMPVTLPALGAYAFLLWSSFRLTKAPPPPQPFAITALYAVGMVVIGAAVWFVGLQVFVLKAFCKYCMAAHGAGLIGAVLLVSSARQRAAHSNLSAGLLPRGFAMAGTGLVLLIAGQLLITKSSFRVETIDSASAPPTTPPATNVSTTTAAEAAKPAQRLLAIHGGQFRLKLQELPMIGSPEAPHVIASLFDYTCHHCRWMHGMIVEAQRHFSNQLAIVSLPMPLDSNCNRLVPQTPSAHVNACQYAKLGLAVWRANRNVFRQFDDWLFDPPRPVPASVARNYAETLVGRENLEKALADPWIDAQIEMDVGIYEANSIKMRSGQIPQLIIGEAITLGPIDAMPQLYEIIQQQFGLPAPAGTAASPRP